ncbi:hypothetical protein L486_04696 [Kwoniella mangroviensis CBS 10435]|uniref:Uncharacterized protein n=1 Tax=Kwoniella mangroviensis CBS 10435 TaxID=1331196 RepID=A0A1B9IPC3_9TREE|nr:hypothetical protein L486_04696 [Kwoniella mangroviensis CBS 10435]
MPQRANNHPSLQRTYQEDMRALAGLVKEKVKFRPRKKGKRKKCQRGIRIANTRIVITLSYAATSQVYHDPLRIDEAQEQAAPFLRVLRFLIHEISETLGIIIIDKCLNTVPALS